MRLKNKYYRCSFNFIDEMQLAFTVARYNDYFSLYSFKIIKSSKDY